MRDTPGADVVFIAADSAVDAPEPLVAMLTRNGLGQVESWSFADPFVERLRFEVDPTWRGELPLTLLAGRDGGVRRVLGAVDFAALKAWIATQ